MQLSYFSLIRRAYHWYIQMYLLHTLLKNILENQDYVNTSRFLYELWSRRSPALAI